MCKWLFREHVLLCWVERVRNSAFEPVLVLVGLTVESWVYPEKRGWNLTECTCNAQRMRATKQAEDNPSDFGQTPGVQGPSAYTTALVHCQVNPSCPMTHPQSKVQIQPEKVLVSHALLLYMNFQTISCWSQTWSQSWLFDPETLKDTVHILNMWNVKITADVLLKPIHSKCSPFVLIVISCVKFWSPFICAAWTKCGTPDIDDRLFRCQ
jgi:hypothetical protein